VKTSFSKLLIGMMALFLFRAWLRSDEIHQAAAAGDLARVKALLEKNPQLLDARDETGRTPLHWACRGVHIEVVGFLVEGGADVNAQDDSAVTPLHSVASRGHVEAATVLIGKGARLDAKMYDLTTPLHLAAQKGRSEVAALLLEKGAPIDARDALEGTPLLAAALEGKSAVVELLANRILAENPAVLNCVDYDGWTALHGAANTGRAAVVKLLVLKGADINIRNTVGQTAYNLAEKGGFKEIADFLTQKGADQSPEKLPKLTGPYLGQTPPGMTPQLFAKGIVSTRPGIYGTIVFSPDNAEAFWKPNVEQLFFMKMENGVWGLPQEFPFKEKYSGLNSPYFSFDGQRLYFSAALAVSGAAGKENIWYVEKNAQGWSEPKLFDPVVNSVPMHWQFSMDRKGNVYTSTDNIYCARFENGQYLAPEKLPPPINTKHAEQYREGEVGPFISPEGDYLIFTRFIPRVKFPIQLFISFRKKDGSWTEPKNLSEKLNSEGNDSAAKLSPDGKYLFFQSVRQGSVPARSLYWVDAKIIDELRPKELTGMTHES
jgi:ankyrin repeat protein